MDEAAKDPARLRNHQPGAALPLASHRIYGHIYGMKTTLVLKDEVVREAKRRAAELGVTLSAFAEQSLRDALVSRPVSLHARPFFEHPPVLPTRTSSRRAASGYGAPCPVAPATAVGPTSILTKHAASV